MVVDNEQQKRYFVSVFGILILCLSIFATITAVSLDTVEFNLSPGESASENLTVVNYQDSPSYNFRYLFSKPQDYTDFHEKTIIVIGF